MNLTDEIIRIEQRSGEEPPAHLEADGLTAMQVPGKDQIKAPVFRGLPNPGIVSTEDPDIRLRCICCGGSGNRNDTIMMPE